MTQKVEGVLFVIGITLGSLITSSVYATIIWIFVRDSDSSWGDVFVISSAVGMLHLFLGTLVAAFARRVALKNLEY